MPYPALDLSRVRTTPLRERHNLVHRSDLIEPGAPPPSFTSPELEEVAERIVAARRAGRPVIWMMGAHVIKCGLGLLVGDLVRRGIITHVATNGAGSIHDFELALIAETSEDVPTAIEDGTFGMAEETGSLMHQAIRAGARDGIGWGEALGRFLAQDPRCPYRELSVLHRAYTLGVPCTVHATMGTDIIDQHPACDFAALGWASGQDFRVFCAAVADLQNGVFLNVGSAVTGPEVFLKALSITRNLGYPVAGFTTANFDLVPLGDYRAPIGKDQVAYYYRPRKNVVNRPVSMGGRGFHIEGDHALTVPTLYAHLTQALGESLAITTRAGLQSPGDSSLDALRTAVGRRSAAALAAFDDLLARQPQLREAALDLARAYLAIAQSLQTGGTLFLCGNGGSYADALHISGEMLKSYARKRPLPAGHRERLAAERNGEALAANLEGGLRAIVLGANGALSSAVNNDFAARDLSYAQELYALARPGDVFLGISTSGKAANVGNAASVAHMLGLTTISLTGPDGGPLAAQVDVPIRAPGARTDRVQESHLLLYHTLCEMLEAEVWG